jgi:ubiquitin carboxyl-terminal hydrolase L5
MSGDDWCTIESDPGVFTELLEELGCGTVQLEELWTLEDETLQALEASGKIHGLIFLFQWQHGAAMAKNATALPEDDTPQDLFFAHQVTTNACATQAILSVVLNATNVDLGPTLSEFKEFTASFPPSLKGVAISSSEPIKKVHNAFGRTDAFLNDGKYVSESRESDDVFHFVAYVPQNGTVYELDGLQTGPIVVGDAGDNWLAVARDAIQERMTGEAIKFNLMAVIQDKRIRLREDLDRDPHAAVQLELEETKRAQWKVENQRRRHNYVPLCVAMLKELARMGKLTELFEEAKEKKRQKVTR